MRQLQGLLHLSVRQLALLLIVAGMALSCVQGEGQRSKTKSASEVTNGNGSNPNNGNGAGSLPNDYSTGTPSENLQSVNIELSHLVDPFTGTYKKKVTIPKNYRGELYIAGLNVAALADKIIKVRFYFGVDRQAITLPATLSRAPGIVPQTEIQVLSVNMRSAPFATWRLSYDLYDYNNYDFIEKPVTSNLDGGLYCRGLTLQYDPTFASQTSSSSCNGAGDKCLYAYAKVSDATLYSGNLTNLPTRPQVWNYASGTKIPSAYVSATSMCLPDQKDALFFHDIFGTAYDAGTGQVVLNGSIFTYKGPYRHTNQDQWRINGEAIYNSEYGLYVQNEVTPLGRLGYQSFLFPRAGNLSLGQGIYYLRATEPFVDADDAGASGTTHLRPTNATGTTSYMNGCNMRVQSYNPTTTEGIGSCTVNANIEVFYEKDGAEIVVTRSSSIKLQIVKESLTNSEGKEVLASSFKRCDDSSTCGGDECCFNSRCWSKDLVAQCVDKLPVLGNQEIGSNCSSDYECGSLCCNQGTGSCAPHDPNGAVPVLCSKNPGQTCVTKDFCKPEYVSTCKLVKLPNLDANGKVQCRVQCTPVLTYGSCSNGLCVPPKTPDYPTNVTDCSQAVDP